jgi:hypothetical protein
MNLEKKHILVVDDDTRLRSCCKGSCVKTDFTFLSRRTPKMRGECCLIIVLTFFVDIMMPNEMVWRFWQS